MMSGSAAIVCVRIPPPSCSRKIAPGRAPANTRCTIATTLRELHALGLLMVLWSVDTSDYQQPGVAAIVCVRMPPPS